MMATRSRIVKRTLDVGRRGPSDRPLGVKLGVLSATDRSSSGLDDARAGLTEAVTSDMDERATSVLADAAIVAMLIERTAKRSCPRHRKRKLIDNGRT